MKNKIYIVIIAIILIATAVIFMRKSKTENNIESSQVKKIEKNTQPANTSSTPTVVTQNNNATDTDIQGIEADLNSIDDANLDSSGISDSEVGL
jgi:hypothetical protein